MKVAPSMMFRRSFFGLLVTTGGAIAAGIIAIPAAITGLSPILRPHRRNAWRAVGRLDSFPIGSVQTTKVAGGQRWPRPLPAEAVFVWRPTSDDLVVFSRRCTDLACPLQHDAGSGCFFCPCHGGIFSQSGEVMAGPPDRPMDRYASRVREGIVEIDLASLPPGV
jgi:menaquinol-cytochrome c reductase iron-sulfur subunit